MANHPSDTALDQSTNRWMVAGVVLFFLFLGAFPLYRWYEPSARAEAREQQRDDLAAQGANLFAVNCSNCHGEEGRGGLAPALASTQFLEMVTDDQINQLIALGVPGSEMVGYSLDYFGPLTSEQIKAITTYLRSLEEVAADNPSWRYPLAQDGLSGREIFLLGCARCHGANLEGTEEGPALGRGSEAAEESDSRLVRRIAEGADEMPRFGGTLNEEQINLIVAYLREMQASD